MELHFKGMLIAISTFLIIGIFHPVVIWVEYHFGTRPWWIFLVAVIASIGAACFIADVMLSAIRGVLGATCLWTIGEIFEQRKRVKKGWFPMNPKRAKEYED